MTREDFLRQEIEKYKRKIATYEAMISEWQGELGASAEINPQDHNADASGKKKVAGTGDPLATIPGMIFFGKSQPEAAKHYLGMVGYPLTTDQILAGIEKGGLTVGGKTPVAKKQNLYTILNRSSEFARVRKDTWAFVGWAGVPKKVVDGADETEPEGDKKIEANNGEASGK
jgi:hypothetical protein